MIKVKFVQGTMYAGVFYRKGEEARLSDEAASALGSSVEKLGKVKEDKVEEKKTDSKPAAKVVKAPAADKMVKSPAKAKEAANEGGNSEPVTPSADGVGSDSGDQSQPE